MTGLARAHIHSKRRTALAAALTVLFAGCATQRSVSEKTAEILQQKYGRPFVVMNVDMNRDEGNWGSASLELADPGAPGLRFSAHFSYSDNRLLWEDYKGRKWSRQIEQELGARLKDTASELRCDITANNSLAFRSMELPDRGSYREALGLIAHPRLIVRGALSGRGTENLPQQLCAAARELTPFLGAGFEKVSASFTSPAGQLSFKLTRRFPVLQEAQAKKIVAEKSVPGGIILGEYMKGLSLYEKNNFGEALREFDSFIARHDHPNRFDPYIVSESGHLYEALFYAAKSAGAAGDTARRNAYFTKLAERLEYREALGEYAKMYEEAVSALK